MVVKHGWLANPLQMEIYSWQDSRSLNWVLLMVAKTCPCLLPHQSPLISP